MLGSVVYMFERSLAQWVLLCACRVNAPHYQEAYLPRHAQQQGRQGKPGPRTPHQVQGSVGALSLRLWMMMMLRWQLLKQLSKSMSGSDLDANEKTYSESTANDDASEEPVGEAKVRRVIVTVGSCGWGPGGEGRQGCEVLAGSG